MNKCKCLSSLHGHLTKECLNLATKENNRLCEYCAKRAAFEVMQAIPETQQTVSQIPKQLPPLLSYKYSEVEKFFINAVQPSADPSVIEESFKKWEELYAQVLKLQPNGDRYHKGGEAHNMGVCLVYTRQYLDGLNYFLLGYVEDLLSEPVQTANSAPGATTLKGFYKLTDVELSTIQKCVQETIKEKGVVQNPQDVLSHFSRLKMFTEIERRVKKITLLIRPKYYPSISHLPGEFEKRVFIGGDYESIHSLDSIISPVREFGFEPIIAMEFDTSDTNIHHDALLLLHNCLYAIFDVSGKGGHMMEAERTLDYGTKTLFVCNKREESRVSAMLKSLGMGYEIHYFDNRSELMKHIFEFLKPEGIEPV